MFVCRFKFACVECGSAMAEEFKLEESIEDREQFEKQWDVSVASQTISVYLKRSESRTIRVSYTPVSPTLSSGLLYIRYISLSNNTYNRYNQILSNTV